MTRTACPDDRGRYLRADGNRIERAQRGCLYGHPRSRGSHIDLGRTVAEVLIVAGRRNRGDEMRLLIGGLGFEIIGATPATAKRMAEAYARWGKGVHPAALNFGDCFAYDVAKEHACRLLCVGKDFPRRDIACVP